MTDYLGKILNDRKLLNFSTSYEKFIVEKIENTHCLVAFDYENELAQIGISEDFEITYTTADGKTIKEERMPQNTLQAFFRLIVCILVLLA